MKLSIVCTMYQSSCYLPEFVSRIVDISEGLNSDYELIFVNDGSPDDSLSLVLQYQAGNTNIKIIDLSRNFGHHAAIVAGLEYTEGDYVFLIDCDL